MALNPVTMDTMPSAQLNIGWAFGISVPALLGIVLIPMSRMTCAATEFD
jgi:hypothetical protein